MVRLQLKLGNWGSSVFSFFSSIGRANRNYAYGAAKATDDFYKKTTPNLNRLWHAWFDPFFGISSSGKSKSGSSKKPSQKGEVKKCEQTSGPSLCAKDGKGATTNSGCVKNAILDKSTGKCSCAANGYTYNNNGSADKYGNRSCGSSKKVAALKKENAALKKDAERKDAERKDAEKKDESSDTKDESSETKDDQD